MTIGPYYFNGSTFPTQAGAPVAIDLLDFQTCCCPDNCLIIAYNEHRLAIGQTAVEAATASDMQDWLEDHYVYFVDHISGPLTPDSTAFLFFTHAAWYAAAGIDGSWLPGDLGKAFAALKWTQRQSLDETYGSFLYVYGTNEANNCDANRLLYLAELAANEWTPESLISRYAAGCYAAQIQDNHWESTHIRGHAAISGLPTHIPHSAIAYGLPSCWSIYPFNAFASGYVEGVFSVLDTFPESISSSHQTALINDNRDDPFSSLGWTCPIVDNRGVGWEIFGSDWLLKWAFTDCTL